MILKLHKKNNEITLVAVLAAWTKIFTRGPATCPGHKHHKKPSELPSFWAKVCWNSQDHIWKNPSNSWHFHNFRVFHAFSPSMLEPPSVQKLDPNRLKIGAFKIVPSESANSWHFANKKGLTGPWKIRYRIHGTPGLVYMYPPTFTYH